ncbi:DUF3618 domain-containing protein [Phytohabitans rumicis]|uniref:DUF3618 domain-containing protein n=1 Tax=Phytohabitans rumicis TaxID=1076125 RepID=A0A6V8L1Y4_9ACTN|nr:DUF3618 domain-containing protein [Phytohabitans rumicis]GFJ88126.1 hypothetical protein Prum_017680 [Phytohabitans rumicis]
MATVNGKVDTQALRAEIQRTRADLGETVQALAAKADVKARVRRSAAHRVESARAHPVPLAAAASMVTGALVAVVVLLMIRRRRR